MNNNEKITCDVAGCKKEFAYRIKGFNLCAEHCFEPGERLEMVLATRTPQADKEEKDGA